MSVIIKEEYVLTVDGKSIPDYHNYDGCFICGYDGDYFMVPDSEWEGVVPEGWEKRVICWKCYLGFREKKGLPKLNYRDWKIDLKS